MWKDENIYNNIHWIVCLLEWLWHDFLKGYLMDWAVVWTYDDKHTKKLLKINKIGENTNILDFMNLLRFPYKFSVMYSLHFNNMVSSCWSGSLTVVLPSSFILFFVLFCSTCSFICLYHLLKFDGQTDRQTNKQTDRQTDIQTERQKDRKTERQTFFCIFKLGCLAFLTSI